MSPQGNSTGDVARELPLLVQTPPTWARLAANNLPVFMADHAVCEQQAALFALNLVAHYPEDEELVERMGPGSSGLAIVALGWLVILGLGVARMRGARHSRRDEVRVRIAARWLERTGLLALLVAIVACSHGIWDGTRRLLALGSANIVTCDVAPIFDGIGTILPLAVALYAGSFVAAFALRWRVEQVSDMRERRSC